MKYMGSKAKIAKEILPIILSGRKENRYYVEPFVGGANIIDKVSGLRIGSDINKYLIGLLIALQNGWTPPLEITKEFYNKVRDNKDFYNDRLVGWVGFNCSYSGKFFAGYAGKTETKNGSVRDYQAEAIKNITNQLAGIKDVVFKNCEYHKLEIPNNSVIYCDPPYQGTTKYKDNFDHKLFWEWCNKMVDKGHRVYVSEYNAPPNWNCVWQKEVSSSLSANGKIGGNKISIEKLFTKIKLVSSFEANQD